MPSTLVHLGLAALLATGLLSDQFHSRAIAVVLAVAAFPDLDTFVGLWILDGGHRTVFHNLVLPTAILIAISWDVRWREDSWLRRRWGPHGVRVAWVSVFAGWLASQVLLDAVFNGANLFWPFYDQFIDLSGSVLVSDRRGFVQTVIELERTADGVRIAAEHVRGGRADTHYYTGVDPGDAAGPDAERLFPIAENGPLLLVMVLGFATAGFRLWEQRRTTLGTEGRHH